MDECIFCKIVAGEIPARKVYEDEEIVAFHDIQPAAPVHFLMIPKTHVPSLAAAGPEHAPVLGRMLVLAAQLAREQGATDGFRTIVNTGRVGRQDVYHLHIHVIGGPNPLPRMIAKE
jgi:histidine triad (HIT) family protein